jgi:cytidine deaminase
MTLPVDDYLVAKAMEARQNSYSPYSNFKVGAAITAEDGTVFSGSNVENASYGLTICAERAAIFKLVNSGRRKITRCVVVGDIESKNPTAPCGACRQVLFEFGGPDLVVECVGRNHVFNWKMSELLPAAFGPSDLGK